MRKAVFTWDPSSVKEESGIRQRAASPQCRATPHSITNPAGGVISSKARAARTACSLFTAPQPGHQAKAQSPMNLSSTAPC